MGWMTGSRLGRLDDRGMQARASLVGAGDGDAAEPGRLQQAAVVRPGKGGAAAGLLQAGMEEAGTGTPRDGGPNGLTLKLSAMSTLGPCERSSGCRAC